MPYDISGNYTLPSPEFPLIPNTLADANTVNTILSDVRTALGQVVLRSGVAAFTGQAKLADGTQALPGLSFSAEGGLGLYRQAAGVLAGVVANTEVFRYTNAAFTFAKEPQYAADPVGDNALTRKAYVLAAAASIASNYVLKAGDTMTGPLINTSTVKVGNGVAGNSARLMVNTLNGTAAGIQLFQDGQESWIMESIAGNTGLRWVNSGAERMRLDASGNLGIGITPTQRLHVAGGNILLDSTSDGNNGIFRIRNSTAVTTLQAYADTNSAFLGTVEAKELRLLTANTERMRIDTSGNVLVGGAANPAGNRLNILDPTSFGIGVYRALDVSVVGSVGEAISIGGLVGSAPTIGSQIVGVLSDANTGYVTFNTRSGGALVERLRIDASGNVGIGTGSPTTRLDVNGGSRFRASLSVYSDTTDRLILEPQAAGGGTLLLSVNAANSAYTQMKLDGSPLIFSVTGTERMRVDSSGDVGIGGAASSGWRLQVTAASTAAPSNAAALRLRNPSDGGVSMLFDNAVGVLARLSAAVSGTGVGTDDGVLTFETTVNGSLTERMRIDSGGNVGIGTSSPSANLDVRGTGNRAIRVRSDSGNTCTLSLLSAGIYDWRLEADTSLRFVQDATERLRIDASGNLGIGASPTQRLELGGAASGQAIYARIGNATLAGLFGVNAANEVSVGTTQAGNLDFFTNNTSRAGIDSAGVFRYGGIEIGYRGLPGGSVSSGAFGAADNGKRIKATAGVTIPNATMADGDIVHVLNTTGGALTITKSITTAYNKNTGTALGATFTLAARGSMTIEFTSGTECYVGGNIS